MVIDDMDEVLVTVIVPIYNVERYLKKTLKCLQDQSLKNFEVVMIDDGSIDGSTGIAKTFSERDRRFKYYRQENKGLSSSRNIGINKAVGKYIIFLDSDDTLTNNALECLYNLAELNDVEFIIFGGQKDYYNENDENIEKEVCCGNTLNTECSYGTELYQYLRVSGSYFTGAPFQFVKRNVLEREKIEFYEGILHEDHLYTFQLLNSVRKCMAIDYKLYHYRMRNDSITKGERYAERFIGFSITFFEMCKWINKKSDLKKNSEILKHIDEIWSQSIKYLIFMKKSELPLKQLKDFKKNTTNYYSVKNFRHYIIYYYLLLRLFHCFVVLLKKWKYEDGRKNI